MPTRSRTPAHSARPLTFALASAACLIMLGAIQPAFGDGVFVRFTLHEPESTRWYVQLGGYIHKPNWYLPRAVFPAGADRKADLRLPSGKPSPWFDLGAHAGKLLHGRMNRAGGVAELPNVTARFVTDAPADTRKVTIELATGPTDAQVVRKFDEQFTGSLTSFLVSPTLAKDAASLETAQQMTDRRLGWAKAASGGRRVSPKHHIIQTSFWGPQRPELNVKEAEVLSLLGFNVVGNQRPEVRAAHPYLCVPGHTHRVSFGPAATQPQIDALVKSHADKQKTPLATGVPYGFADEICARPRIGDNDQARAHFHAWLAERGVQPAALGVKQLSDVVPLETPEALRAAEQANASAARRVFYYTNRFRQLAGTQRIRWHTEAFHRHFAKGPLTSTLVADHPYFGGTGLGMGMKPNTTWGGAPLALDWFDLARRRAVDLIGIEDWMGLQYMYGPNYTWEGFQLMGFQAAMFRSGGRGRLPIIAWITPSDETNLRLKSHSALCQGAKHFFYWTYGPTATSTENYWSDLRGSYDGIVRVTRQLAAAEHVIHPGKMRPTRVALLYSISSDLWQPFGYIHMLERRGTYLSLVHDQFLVDMLTEEDIEAGRLQDYDVLYATDPCITDAATKKIADWVRAGGYLYGSCAAGTRNQFNEPTRGLAAVFGVQPNPATTVQPGEYRVRGRLNHIPALDRLTLTEHDGAPTASEFDLIGVRANLEPAGGEVVGRFKDGGAAAVVHAVGKGRAFYVGATPGVSYIKDARFVPAELKEKWPKPHRSTINAWARAANARPVAKLSHPVVEAGVYDSDQGTALVLANFTYEPIEALRVALPMRSKVSSVRLAGSTKPLAFEAIPADARLKELGYPAVVRFTIPLGLDEIVLLK